MGMATTSTKSVWGRSKKDPSRQSCALLLLGISSDDVDLTVNWSKLSFGVRLGVVDSGAMALRVVTPRLEENRLALLIDRRREKSGSRGTDGVFLKSPLLGGGFSRNIRMSLTSAPSSSMGSPYESSSGTRAGLKTD